MDDITLWPAHQQAQAIAKGELSSRELLEAQLARIEAVNPSINAVVILDADRAREAATAADAAVAKGEPLGALHGLPVTLKDAYVVEGWRSTGGSAHLADHVADEDAPVAAALREAGVVVLGRTNVPEWSGDLQTFNAVFGTTNNPWDTSRSPGGSSGGAAAAVATGMTSFELGTDIGGSIRIPASWSGVCGHKPSWGLVPTEGYLDHPGVGWAERAINVFGPLARTVDDLELVLDVVAGPTPWEATAWRLELPPARATDASSLRVAAWLDDPACRVDTAVVGVLEAAVDALERSGARVDRSARPDVDFAAGVAAAMATVVAEVSISSDEEAFAFLRNFENHDISEAMRLSAAGLTAPHRGFLQAQEIRHRQRRAWRQFFADWDILLAPVIASPAIPHDQESPFADRTVHIDGEARPYLDLIGWTTLIGGAELPSTVVPVGFTPGGLPVGMQVIGPHLEDRTALAAARLVEQATGGFRPPTPPST